MTREDWQEAGFGIYIHWPFCLAKCPYCDFNSHVRGKVDTAVWQGAFLAEIDRVAEETPGRRIDSVFFGGGTPSLMPPALVGALLDRIALHWSLGAEAEVTLEANPTSAESASLAGFRAAGVNRVSIGVQALDDAALRLLGRQHSAAEALAAVGMAREIFDRVSFDLIYARQGQSLADWEHELRAALAIGTDHLSLYQLTIEEGTVFGRRHAAGRLPDLPDEDLAADLHGLTQSLCEAAGLPGYEVSNHARPGAESRHNLVYWRSGDYAGIGPGAHGRLTLDGQRLATISPSGPEEWLTRVLGARNGEAAREALTARDRAVELGIMGLRLDEGLDLARLRRFARDLPDAAALDEMQDLGLVESRTGRLRLTAAGRPLLDAILRRLF